MSRKLSEERTRKELIDPQLEQEEYDEVRTEYLKSQGYEVIRFWNNDVMKNVDGVILAIIQAMEDESKKD